MEKSLEIKRAGKPPCKNDRKAYLQKVMLTRYQSINSSLSLFNNNRNNNPSIFMIS